MSDHHEGAACFLCGEDANGIEPRIETSTGPLFNKPTCQDCHTDQLTECPGCSVVIFQQDGYRSYPGRTSLYCARCAEEINAAVAEQAMRADIARDEFNQRRR